LNKKLEKDWNISILQ